jgi:hypothetical protein
MNATAIFAILEKGLTALPILVNAGMDIYSLATRLATVAKDAKEGKSVDPAEVAALEADLDAGLAEFNSPMPPDVA